MSEGARFVSLKAVTAIGNGERCDLGHPLQKHTLQVVITGDPTQVKVLLVGSLDGTNFATMATWDTATGDVSGGMLSVSDAPMSWLRADLDTLTAGTSPTVTAIIASSP